LSKGTTEIIARFFRERADRATSPETIKSIEAIHQPSVEARSKHAVTLPSDERTHSVSSRSQPIVATSSWQVLDQLTIYHRSEARTIEICQGDLANIPPDEAVDILVVSALPNNHHPSRSSLIGALHRKGVSVEALAQDKAEDLRPNLACWLSKPITKPNAGIQFERILCFEPQHKGAPAEVVGDIFQCLISLSETQPIRQVAMPLLGGGVQGVSTVDMVMPLFDAATHWLELGLPIERLKIVAYNDRSAAELQGAFGVLKRQYEQRKISALPCYTYDLFISYCWQNKDDVDFLVAELKHLRPKLRIFLDRVELNTGCAWQQKIYEALDDCRKVVTIYSPAYLASKVCREEFNIAVFRHRETNDVLLPIYLETAQLPTQMKMIQYIDCRESDRAKLRQASAAIVAQL
jgi:hypothetical protein